MAGERPLYLMIKPPEREARKIDLQRQRLGIDTRYEWKRFHTTVMPLGDGSSLPDAKLELLDHTVRDLRPAPFWLEFERLRGNALIAGKGAGEVRAFQRRASGLLTSRGVRLPRYQAHPHLSLAYGPPAKRIARIQPSGWQVTRVLLIRSIHGEGRHETIHEWEMTSEQYQFNF